MTCVTNLVKLLDSCPPIATTAPMIASLSPSGNPAQQITMPENMSRGSGVKDRSGACLFLNRDAVIQPGVMTEIIRSHAWLYCWKSDVADTMCVTSSSLILPSAFNFEMVAPFSSRVACNYVKVVSYTPTMRSSHWEYLLPCEHNSSSNLDLE